jgi:hypothetical protein
MLLDVAQQKANVLINTNHFSVGIEKSFDNDFQIQGV